MTIDVTTPFREEIAEDGSEMLRIDKGIEIGDSPSPNSTYPVQGFIITGLHGNLPPVPNTWDESVLKRLLAQI
jgi:hypothetical protein